MLLSSLTHSVLHNQISTWGRSAAKCWFATWNSVACGVRKIELPTRRLWINTPQLLTPAFNWQYASTRFFFSFFLADHSCVCSVAQGDAILNTMFSPVALASCLATSGVRSCMPRAPVIVRSSAGILNSWYQPCRWQWPSPYQISSRPDLCRTTQPQ